MAKALLCHQGAVSDHFSQQFFGIDAVWRQRKSLGKDGFMRLADKDTGSRELRPDEIRQVLGQNLRKLLKREDSVVSFCQKIGLNRTQFNRYISGEAHPRPDILHKICQYFAVDARILLQPLEQLNSAPRVSDRPDLDLMVQNVLRSTTSVLGPQDGYTGMYRIWRRAFTDAELVVTGLLQMSHNSGVMALRYYEPNSGRMHLPDRSDLQKKDRYNGICVKTDGGVSAIIHRDTAAERELIFGLMVIDRAEQPMPNIFRCVYSLTRQNTLISSRTVGMALERLPDDCASWRDICRAPRVQPISAVPSSIRRIINHVPPQA